MLESSQPSRVNTGILITPNFIMRIPLKWRYITTKYRGCQGSSKMTITENPLGQLGPITDTEVSDWFEGGVAIEEREVCKNLNTHTKLQYTRYTIQEQGYLSKPYRNIYGEEVYSVTIRQIEIDFSDALQRAADAHSPDEYWIGDARLTDVNGNDERPFPDSSITPQSINQNYQEGSGESQIIAPTNTTFSSTPQEVTPLDQGGETVSAVWNQIDDVNVPTVDQTGTLSTKSIEGYGCTSDTQSYSMYLQLLMLKKDYVDLANPEEAAVVSEDEIEAHPDADPDPFDFDTGSSDGFTISSGKASASKGVNSFVSSYGNTRIPFDSVYLVGNDFNSFVSAGGGIIGESGVFPNSDTIYIDKISLSVEGSSMTIVEVCDFDDTPSLTVSEKIYGYILDSTNQDKPAFCGYIVSQQRILQGNNTQIVYECKDLTHFLSQLYTPSHYVYRPPSVAGKGVVKSYDTVLKEVFNLCGLSNAVIDMPTRTAPPVTWVYQNIRSVLEWCMQYFGKHVFYCDRYGRINVRATDSLSYVKSYAIGNKSGDISVESFDPLSDFSRSRSRIILTGDFALTEKTLRDWFSVRGGDTPPQTNTSNLGLFWFSEDITNEFTNQTTRERFYYFLFRPSETLNRRLLSDPAKSARVIASPNSILSESSKELSMKVFRAEPGDSEIYIEDGMFKESGSTHIQMTYCVQSDSPIQVYADTGYFGGTEVVHRPEFKKATFEKGKIDDTALMQQYLLDLKNFYKPIYGGKLHLDGLDTDIELLSKVSITGSTLPLQESQNLICYGIEYDLVNRRTTIELSNKTFGDLPFFDTVRERSRKMNELATKMGLLEEMEFYRKL